MLQDARLSDWSLTRLRRTDRPESGQNRLMRSGRNVKLRQISAAPTCDERRVDQTEVLQRREGSQLPQELVGGVRVAVQD